MKRFGTAKFSSVLILGVAWLALSSSAAFAGANQGAALLVSCGSVSKTTPATCTALGGKLCGQLTPSTNTQLAPLLSWIAVYVGRSQPDTLTQLSGVDFGIDYNPDALYLPAWTHCGSLEVNGTAWPLPGTGNTVVWVEPQTGQTVLVGYFTVAKYEGFGSFDWTLQAHPLYGVARVVDGASNFDDLRYPAIANLGGSGGSNPDCAVAIKPTTWGSIKSLYLH